MGDKGREEIGMDELRSAINRAIVEDPVGNGRVSSETMDRIMDLIAAHLAALSDRS